ncbi:hypothetical protein PIB30_077094 [Stylosanthes scabra]|uniref:Uncharacterized protein n=1 Tax=Stylosanthes scabra TaxID=79078 RepID=A0ABU6WQ39_9FABA|nr:hypothetical protein [Stylosanthes scabra]
MAKQISTMTKKLEKIEVSAVSRFGETSLPCGLCGGPHDSQTCSFIMDDQSSSEQVNFAGGTIPILVGDVIRDRELTTTLIIRTGRTNPHFSGSNPISHLPYQFSLLRSKASLVLLKLL